MVRAGIPVLGHIGLTPQSILNLGSYRVQGKKPEAARRLLEDAVALEEAGAFAVVLEALPVSLAEEITGRVGIPTIGIGAGPSCDGQVLVSHDMLGMFLEFKPKFVKQYADLKGVMLEAFKRYKKEVEEGIYPSEEYSY
jgi:3-methyl-2-oxobutanoate hydroxymethyltransferase